MSPSDININRIRFSFIFLALFVLFVFTSIRYDVGWDYQVYYRTIINYEQTNIVSRGELFTNLLIDLARYYQSAFLYFFLNALIFYVFFFLSLVRFNVSSYIPVLLFLAFPLFFINSLSVVRTFTAISLVFYAVSFLSERKLVQYFILVYLASCFHTSALLAIVFPFISYVNLRAKNYVFIFISGFIAKFFLEYLIFFSNPVLENYLKPTLIQEGTKAIYFFALLMCIMLFFKDKFVRSNAVYSTQASLAIFNIYFVGFMIYVVFMEYGTLGHRLSLYGTFLSLIILPKLFLIFRPINFSVMISFSFGAVMFVLYYLTLLVAGESIVPYSIILI